MKSIQDVKDAKKKLETDIENLIQKFEYENGVSISSDISISRQKYYADSGDDILYERIYVEISIEI